MNMRCSKPSSSSGKPSRDPKFWVWHCMAYNKTFLLNDAQIGYGLLFWIYHITRLDIQQGVKPHELLSGYSFIHSVPALLGFHHYQWLVPNRHSRVSTRTQHSQTRLGGFGMFRSVPGSSSQKRCVADLPWST